ncbi:MAG TPA: thermostable hemolysin [Methylophilus sp.]
MHALSTTPPAIYTAEPAYYLRAFASTKRYQVSEITAHTVAKDAPCRAEVEAFIHAVFKQAYGANITQFMPDLVALRDANGILMAAFGLHAAAHERLFLEQYIDVPIEQLMSSGLGRPIQREEITCIGNLAVANPRNAGVLIAHVIQHSLDIGIEWCVATAHHSLQNGLIKGGRDVYALAPADHAKLPADELAHWGSYYRHLPQIVAVRGVAAPL